MEQLPAVIELDLTTLPATVKELIPTQLGWLGMEYTKRKTFEALGKAELEIQGKVAVIMNKPYTNVELTVMKERQKEVVVVLKEAKGMWATMEAQRKYLTGFLTDNVITPAMLFEKRSREELDKAETHEFQMRLAIETETAKQQGLINEKAAYKAHIENEVNRIRETYRATLKKLALDCYAILLNDKEPVSELPRFKRNLVELMNKMKLETPVVYNRVLVSDEAAVEIIGTVQMYDNTADLQEAINSVDSVFVMYEQDLANSTVAAARIEEQKVTLANETAATIQQEAAITNITARAGTFQFEGGPKVKKNQAVVIENSDAWGLAVMGNFIRLFNDVRKYVAVKEWEKLTVNQMATALGKYVTETAEQLPGLKIEEIKK